MAEFSDVEPGEAKLERPRSPRRWLQFGFSTLLKVVAAAAGLSAWWADRERLTDRIGRLENDQSVLRIALGDDIEGAIPSLPPPSAPWPLTLASGAGGYGPPLPAPPSSVPPRVLGPPPASPGYPSAVRGYGTDDVYSFLSEHKQWLKTNFADDPGWQEFLAKGRQAGPPPQALSPVAIQQGYVLEPPEPDGPPMAARRPPPPAPPKARPVVTNPEADDPLVAPLPLEAPDASASNVSPSEFRPLDASRPLASDATDKQCLPALLKLLAAGDPTARIGAATLLANTGSSPASAAASAGALADAANDSDEAVRDAALSSLAILGPAAKPAASRLAVLLRDHNARCRPVHLASVLLRIDPQADVVPRLAESLGDPQVEVRLWTLQLLSSLGRSRAAIAATAAAELLTDENALLRVEAATTYSRLADARDAIPVLRAALANEKDRAVKRHFAQAIMRLQNGSQ